MITTPQNKFYGFKSLEEQWHKGCYFCGRHTNTRFNKEHEAREIHHIDLNRKNNVRQNLVVLCKLCHAKLHRTIYERLKKVGMIKYSLTAVNIRHRQIEGAKKKIVNLLDLFK